jgi:uncharacterized protein YkwD
MINGIMFTVGMIIAQVAAPGETLGELENIYTVEYGNVTGRKILNGELAGQYRILTPNQAVESAEGQFLALVNQHRANHGLGAIGWSQEAANIASTNNAVHAPHSIYGSQVWAGASDFVSAFNMWVASPAHNAILLGARSAIGVARCVTGCTANAY